MGIKMGLLSFVSRFALGGTAGPILLGAVWWCVNNASGHNLSLEIALEKITLVIWPSSLALTAGAGFGNTSMSTKLFVLAMILNVILYSVVGVLVWYGLRKHHVLLLLPVFGIGALWIWLLKL